VIQKAPFNTVMSILIAIFMLVGTIPAQGACPCGSSTADCAEPPQGTRDKYPQPHDCCNGGKLTQFDFDQGCTSEALPYICAVLPRLKASVPAVPSALSTKSPLFPTIVSCLFGRDLTHPEEGSGPLDFRNLTLRC
jgi:hypothetical protein